jgi:CelD/BcsL family acetyltransferase involved in cellulose biosynthesis
MALVAEILVDEAEVAPFREGWDRLAVRLGEPFSQPAWMLAWWRHASPAGAALRVVAVRDGDRLVGLAPLWVADPTARSAHYDVLTARLSLPAVTLVDPERGAEIAALLARTVSAARPRPSLLRLEGRSATHERVTAPLLAAWPGLRPSVVVSESQPLPLAILADGYEEWLARRSHRFCRDVRARLRKVEKAGGRFELTTAEDVERVVDAYLELHRQRWRDRGGSAVMIDGLREMLLDAAVEMVPAERLRLFRLELGGKIVAVQICLSAGPEVAGLSGGFDHAARRLAPSTLVILRVLEDAAARGQERANLGPGGQEYKRRMADDEDRMEVFKLIPKGRSWPRTRLQFARDRLRTVRDERRAQRA